MNDRLDIFRGRENILFFAALALLVFGCLTVTGNLFSGPRLYDENKIYELQIEFKESGFLAALKEDVVSRWYMHRLVPVYCTQKVILAKLFGTNLFLWSIYTGLLGVLAGYFLFLFGRTIGFDTITAALFSLLTIVGEQSVLWWRLLHGEGIGLVFFSAGLLVLSKGFKGNNRRLEYSSILFFILASLSKESFILMLPAVMLFRALLPRYLDNTISYMASIKASWRVTLSMFVALTALLLVIKFGIGQTSYKYTGWKGFDPGKLATIIDQFANITNFTVVLLSLVAAVLLTSWLGRTDDKPPLRALGHKLILPAAFFFAATIPQLLLYMSSGFTNPRSPMDLDRYLIPGMLGFSFLIACTIDLAKESKLKYLFLITVAIASVQLIDKGRDAFVNAMAYAKETAFNDEPFSLLSKNVGKDKNIGIVFLNGAPRGASLQAALRVYYILSQGYGYDNVYFTPYPERPTIEETKPHIFRRDTRRHADKMRNLSELMGDGKPDAIIFLNWGMNPHRNMSIIQFLERSFFINNRTWIDFGNFTRTTTEFGDVIYFREPSVKEGAS